MRPRGAARRRPQTGKFPTYLQHKITQGIFSRSLRPHSSEQILQLFIHLVGGLQRLADNETHFRDVKDEWPCMQRIAINTVKRHTRVTVRL